LTCLSYAARHQFFLESLRITPREEEVCTAEKISKFKSFKGKYTYLRGSINAAVVPF
jgi:hypothetical protein